ncbi:MAG: tryptophan 7-halogenase [Planctomycetaceae bacterium]|nr:tryptophan 7-halogenase [Planctomycetaceae bacterium]
MSGVTEKKMLDPSISSIVILGGGTAGCLAALGIRKHLPDIPVTLVRSTKMGVIGVGEGTIWSVVNYLHNFLGLEPSDFYRQVCPSIKLGIHYLWGPRDAFNYTFTPQFTGPTSENSHAVGYYCDDSFEFANVMSALMAHDKVCLRNPAGEPVLKNGFAYHLENKRFVGFLEATAAKQGVQLLDDIVDDVVLNEGGVQRLMLQSGQEIEGDLFLDCSGFRAELIGRGLNEPFVDFSDSLFCDRAIFGGWEREPDDIYHPYTTAETMDSGWSWQIEHDHVVNRGYVFCSQFASDTEAEEEFRQRNPKVKDTKAVKFQPGSRRRVWVKNVVALGNAAGFVEPLEATAIGMICDGVVNLVRAIKSGGSTLMPEIRDAYNRNQANSWEIIRDFLALHYRFNTRRDTPFWQACVADTPLGKAQKYVDYYQAVGPDFSLLKNDLGSDFFDSEGYLSMLVGQDVPYRRQPEISFAEKHAWKLRVANLRDMMHDAMDMREYLEAVRASTVDAQQPMQAMSFSHDGMGELQWH